MDEDEIDELGWMLEDKGLSHSEIDDYFQHHGVPGMKWGKRRQRKLDRTTRVASGTGSKIDKLRVLGNQSTISLARGHGLKGAAARSVKRQTGQKERIQTGHAKVRDLLALHGGDALSNFGSDH